MISPGEFGDNKMKISPEIDLPKPTMPDDIPPYTEEELHPDEN